MMVHVLPSVLCWAAQHFIAFALRTYLFTISCTRRQTSITTSSSCFCFSLSLSSRFFIHYVKSKCFLLQAHVLQAATPNRAPCASAESVHCMPSPSQQQWRLLFAVSPSFMCHFSYRWNRISPWHTTQSLQQHVQRQFRCRKLWWPSFHLVFVSSILLELRIWNMQLSTVKSMLHTCADEAAVRRSPWQTSSVCLYVHSIVSNRSLAICYTKCRRLKLLIAEELRWAVRLSKIDRNEKCKSAKLWIDVYEMMWTRGDLLIVIFIRHRFLRSSQSYRIARHMNVFCRHFRIFGKPELAVPSRCTYIRWPFITRTITSSVFIHWHSAYAANECLSVVKGFSIGHVASNTHTHHCREPHCLRLFVCLCVHFDRAAHPNILLVLLSHISNSFISFSSIICWLFAENNFVWLSVVLSSEWSTLKWAQFLWYIQRVQLAHAAAVVMLFF